MQDLIEIAQNELIPGVRLESLHPHEPVTVRHVPQPWRLIGVGNYAAVFFHPDYPELAVKIYAPGRPGFDEEVEVYRRLGHHPAFSECLYAGDGFMVLKRLHGTTLYDCLHYGIPICRQVIRDVDEALRYARARGLRPHDVHGRNIVQFQGRGMVVDVSDFLKEGEPKIWTHVRRAYFLVYRPVLLPLRLRVSYRTLNASRHLYRRLRRLLSIS